MRSNAAFIEEGGGDTALLIGRAKTLELRTALSTHNLLFTQSIKHTATTEAVILQVLLTKQS